MIFRAYGHPNITALHNKTIEFTKDAEISKKADCILGVKAEFDPKELEFLKQKIKVEISISADNVSDKVIAYGSPELLFKEPHGLIIRKSNVITDKTIALFADKTAKNINKDLIQKLKNPLQEIVVEINKIGEYNKLDFYEGLQFV